MSAARVYDAGMSFTPLTLDQFLDSVAAKTPAPGGGAVASAVGALSAALAGMVVSYSTGKKNLAPTYRRDAPAQPRAAPDHASTSVSVIVMNASSRLGAMALISMMVAPRALKNREISPRRS